MGKAMINPPSLARPRGFSHGVLVTGGMLLFLAGQTASDAEGQIVAPGNLVAQYEQVLRNLQTVVEAAGGTMQDIVKITIFVSDRDSYLAQLKPLGNVHKAFFGNYYPATALLEISRFYQDDALIEIEGIAVIGADE
ncbi:MAG: RidA family protein [Ktedonobacteraceae bacterium]